MNENNKYELSQQTVDGASTSPARGEVVLGTFVGLDSAGRPLVEYSSSPDGQAVAAISTVCITSAEAGRAVALLFADGDCQKPVIMGVIQNSLYSVLEATLAQSGGDVAEADNNCKKTDDVAPDPSLGKLADSDVRVDGERVVIEGDKEIVLKCGESSITLTKAGKIIIRGKYLLNRSSGVNRIMGGSVQVN